MCHFSAYSQHPLPLRAWCEGHSVPLAPEGREGSFAQGSVPLLSSEMGNRSNTQPQGKG